MNLPNKITLARIFMIPVFVVFFYVEFPYHELVSALVFLLAAFTDFLDGHIARKYHLVTNMGKFLDPIADKVLVSTALILMLANPTIFILTTGDLSSYLWTIPSDICIALILARELIVSGFRLLAVERGIVLAKIKTVTQDVSIALLLAVMPFYWGSAGNFKGANYVVIVGVVLLWIATILTVISGINYIVKNRQVLKEEPAANGAPSAQEEPSAQGETSEEAPAEEESPNP